MKEEKYVKYVLLLLGIIAAIFLFACSSKEVADTIVLPKKEDIISVAVENNDVSFACTDMEQIIKITSLLKDMMPTSKSSVNDLPLVDDYISISFHCSNDTVETIFFYEDNGKMYAEQPYQGVYILTSASKTSIAELLDNANSRRRNLMDGA